METRTKPGPDPPRPAFRPSYQGWKRQNAYFHHPPVTLLDLPIRDGNPEPHSAGGLRRSFRPSYQGWKRQGVPSLPGVGGLLDLPIRDGNSKRDPTLPTVSPLLDLPIRDGNPPYLHDTDTLTHPFRPSYQGWKHCSLAGSFAFCILLDLPIRDGNYRQQGQKGE